MKRSVVSLLEEYVSPVSASGFAFSVGDVLSKLYCKAVPVCQEILQDHPDPLRRPVQDVLALRPGEGLHLLLFLHVNLLHVVVLVDVGSDRRVGGRRGLGRGRHHTLPGGGGEAGGLGMVFAAVVVALLLLCSCEMY